MIPRENLKKIRQIEIRTNRRVGGRVAAASRLELPVSRSLPWLAILLFCLSSFPARAEAQWQAALREQTDPAKLATLGKRGANPRVNRVLYYVHQAEASGVSPQAALQEAFEANSTTGAVASLTLAVQLRNYRRAKDWGLFTDENLGHLRRGEAATISRGASSGGKTEVDHIVPISWAPEAGNSLANLQVLSLHDNRSKGSRIGWTAMRHAGRLHEAGLISTTTLWWVRWAGCRRWLMPFAVLAVILWAARRRRHKLGAGAGTRPLAGLLGGLFRGRWQNSANHQSLIVNRSSA